jgi:hypothetical protein
MIRQPHPRKIELLPQIENQADRRYARVGLRRIIDMPPASIPSLERGRRAGLLWVAVSPLGSVVGFALMTATCLALHVHERRQSWPSAVAPHDHAAPRLNGVRRRP